MNRKDQNTLKKALGNVDETPAVKMASAYVDGVTKELKIQDPSFFHRIDDSEAERYCGFFKKGISGKIGTLATDVAAEDGNPVDAVRTEDFSRKSLVNLFNLVKNNYITDDSYGIFAVTGSLAPKKSGSDDEPLDALPYEFTLLLVGPCITDAPGLIYEPSDNTYKDKALKNGLKPPVCAFLYPSYSDGEADPGHAMCFAKNVASANTMSDLSHALFGTEIPSTPEKQEEGFTNIVEAAYPGRVPFEPLQNLYGFLDDLKTDAETEGTEPVLSAKELADAVLQCGDVSDEGKNAVREAVADNGDIGFSVSGLAPKNVTMETDYATVKVDLHNLSAIRKEVIDGTEYLLIPASNLSMEKLKAK